MVGIRAPRTESAPAARAGRDGRAGVGETEGAGRGIAAERAARGRGEGGLVILLEPFGRRPAEHGIRSCLG